MKPLIRVGFYREMRHGRPDDPSLLDAMQQVPDEDEGDVVGYLRSGVLLLASPGIARDVLAPSGSVIGPPHILTDGTYAWPGEFVHYVGRYHARPPSPFVAHMAANHWTVPGEIDVSSLQLG